MECKDYGNIQELKMENMRCSEVKLQDFPGTDWSSGPRELTRRGLEPLANMHITHGTCCISYRIMCICDHVFSHYQYIYIYVLFLSCIYKLYMYY